MDGPVSCNISRAASASQSGVKFTERADPALMAAAIGTAGDVAVVDEIPKRALRGRGRSGDRDKEDTP